MKNISLIFLSILLTACGTQGTINSELLNQPIAKNYARLIINRDSSFKYATGAAVVSLDGLEVAQLATGASVIKDVAQGEHILSVKAPIDYGDYKATFNAHSGKTYHFLISPNERKSSVVVGLFGALGEVAEAGSKENIGYFMIKPTE